MLKAAKAYLATQVSTSSQGDLLIMLYDTAVKQLRQAIEKMRAGDVAGKGVLISKAINIISELQESLNKERGGDISKNLFQLYFFCNARLLKANLKMDQQMVEEVIGILTGLRQAFAQIIPTAASGVAAVTQATDAAQTAQAAETPAMSGATASAAPEPVAGKPVMPEPEAPELDAPEAQQRVSPAQEGVPSGAARPSTLRLRAANAYATTR